MSLNPLRNIPSVSELLENPKLKGLVDRISHNAVVDTVRTVLDEMRGEVQNAVGEKTLPNVAELAERIARRVMETESLGLRPVINATGILLHTGLGRAPLAEESIAEMNAVARDYASLEIDLAGGKRSRRSLAVEPLLKELTGCEAALVVNNNAGATMLVLAALGWGKEVIVSRGQLIEIGGSFRLPDVMALSGAILREVGTTNKTHLADYASAIGEQTAALMLVHPSNYLVQGFAESVELPALVELGKKHRLPVIHDIGSGALIDFAQFGLPGEPMAKQSLADGADVVLFSGDKLIGGPQCGIILGRKAAIEKIQKHPFARALRVDKLTLAALAATLRLYRDEEKAKLDVPLLRLLGTSPENLKNRAERLAPQIAAVKKAVAAAEAVQDITYLGGGSIPTQQLCTWCIAVTPAGMTVDRLAAVLRAGTPAVVGRIRQDRLLLDLRSVFPRQDVDLVAAVEALGAE
ncbi:MAG: L-seryl-tRNA(Sec) selenium transferase [Pirellulales bacterium]|nr:L-seryl-tRNA(Sec) selenium transferase [Pirellulales bacterium]